MQESQESSTFKEIYRRNYIFHRLRARISLAVICRWTVSRSEWSQDDLRDFVCRRSSRYYCDDWCGTSSSGWDGLMTGGRSWRWTEGRGGARRARSDSTASDEQRWSLASPGRLSSARPTASSQSTSSSSSSSLRWLFVLHFPGQCCISGPFLEKPCPISVTFNVGRQKRMDCWSG